MCTALHNNFVWEKIHSKNCIAFLYGFYYIVNFCVLLRIHSNFLYGKNTYVILYGKKIHSNVWVLCNIFLYGNFCMRIIHSKFLYGNFLYGIFCMKYFCMGKTLTFFIVAIFCMVFFLCSIPASPYLYTLWFSPFCDTTQLYHHHWIEQGRLPLVHAKNIPY